jgi:hypothetical protein
MIAALRRLYFEDRGTFVLVAAVAVFIVIAALVQIF